MAGTIYSVAPIAPDPEHTSYADAGTVSFGVEYRLLDDAGLVASYQGADMVEIQEALQGNGVEDNGVSVRVIANENGHEYLRFDCFEKAPHDHYIEASGEKQTIVEYDPVAMGEMLAWTMHQLRTRLAPMLEHAGGKGVALGLDTARVAASLVEVEALANRAREAAPCS